jgi:hypothetical protein
MHRKYSVHCDFLDLKPFICASKSCILASKPFCFDLALNYVSSTEKYVEGEYSYRRPAH